MEKENPIIKDPDLNIEATSKSDGTTTTLQATKAQLLHTFNGLSHWIKLSKEEKARTIKEHADYCNRYDAGDPFNAFRE